MADIAAQLQALQEAAGRFAALVGGLDAALPEDVSGWDETRTVCVRVSRSGMPIAVLVRDGWATALEPGTLGQAVVRAAGAAAGARAQALSEMLRADAVGLPGDHIGPGPVHPGGVSATPDQHREPQMSLGDLAEDAISALSLANTAAEPAAQPIGTGTGANGAVTITASGGVLSSCTVDERWAEGRSTLQVSMALQQALDGARQSLAEAERQAPAEGSLDDLLAEAMAHLFSITGTPERGTHHE